MAISMAISRIRLTGLFSSTYVILLVISYIISHYPFRPWSNNCPLSFSTLWHLHDPLHMQDSFHHRAQRKLKLQYMNIFTHLPHLTSSHSVFMRLYASPLFSCRSVRAVQRQKEIAASLNQKSKQLIFRDRTLKRRKRNDSVESQI